MLLQVQHVQINIINVFHELLCQCVISKVFQKLNTKRQMIKQSQKSFHICCWSEICLLLASCSISVNQPSNMRIIENNFQIKNFSPIKYENDPTMTNKYVGLFLNMINNISLLSSRIYLKNNTFKKLFIRSIYLIQ